MCKIGLLQQALRAPLNWVGINVYVPILQYAAAMREVAEGKCSHARMIKIGYEPNIFVNNNLAIMYAKCGYIKDARQVFDKMSERSVVSWNVIIAGYVWDGQYEEAMEVFCQMLEGKLQPNQFTFGSVFGGVVASKEEGKGVHALAVKFGFEFDLFVQSALVDMYAKCKCMEEAHIVFDKIPIRGVVSWNAIIAGNVQNGSTEEAIRLFCEMQQTSLSPNQITFASIPKACSDGLVQEVEKLVHANVITSQLDLDVSLWNALIDMYAKCGSIEDALCVFNRIPERDIVSWNALLAGYALNGHNKDVLELFREMQMEDVKLDEFTFATVFKACDNLISMEQGKQVHALIIKTGFQSNLLVGTNSNEFNLSSTYI